MSAPPRTFGAYTLLKSLGPRGGGAAEAWVAKPQDPDSGLPSPVVVKVLVADLGCRSRFFERFEQEAQAAAQIRSPYLPKVLDAGRVDDEPYVTTEYVAGWSLRRIMDDLHDAHTEVSLRSAVDLLAGVCRGLTALHEAVPYQRPEDTRLLVHQDVTPETILLGEDGKGGLMDLGLWARPEDRGSRAPGTPGYMAPEQVRGGPVDARTDVYALGLVLWELLTLQPYIERGPAPLVLRRQSEPIFRPPSALRADLPPDVDDICERALAPAPKDRLPSTAAFETLLRASMLTSEQDGGVLSTLVGEMLWGELGQDKSNVTQLLSLNIDLPEDGGPGESFVLPEVITLPDADPVTEADEPTLISQPRAEALAEPTLISTPREKLGLPAEVQEEALDPPTEETVAPSADLCGWVYAGLMVLTLAAGMGVAALVLRSGALSRVVPRDAGVSGPIATPPPPLEAAEAREKTPRPKARAVRDGGRASVAAPLLDVAPVEAPDAAAGPFGGAQTPTPTTAADADVGPGDGGRPEEAPSPERGLLPGPERLRFMLAELEARARRLARTTKAGPRRQAVKALMPSIEREMASPSVEAVKTLRQKLEALAVDP